MFLIVKVSAIKVRIISGRNCQQITSFSSIKDVVTVLQVDVLPVWSNSLVGLRRRLSDLTRQQSPSILAWKEDYLSLWDSLSSLAVSGVDAMWK